METRYDYIIAGGGCAGLSLAYHLSRSSLSGCSILLIDQDEKERNDRTWCFWADAPMPFDPIVFRKWKRLAFADSRGRLSQSIGKRSYQLIRGADFYRFVRSELARFPNIHRLQGRITTLNEDNRGPYALVDGRRYYGELVFNSCMYPPRPAAPRFHQLLQHFSGWVIRAQQACFDPGEALLMDFRTPQLGSARFFYVLPFSEREALVEYTVFSPAPLPREEYSRCLHAYIRDQLKLADYEVLETEYGVIPMTDAPFPERLSEGIINIGTVGGAVKPTTGYTFLNIQEQTQQVVRQLEAGERLSPARRYPRRFRFYDRLLLHILEKKGHLAAPIFSALFRRSPFSRILTFLEERSNLAQEAAIFSSLPKKPFLQAVFETMLKPQPAAGRPFVVPASEKQIK